MKTERAERPLRVGLISLGCAKNLVDAEIMLGSLLEDGFEILNDATQADALIVNTCSFIDAAQAESVDAILESAELREARRPGQALIVAGCLPQRFRDELPKLLPEVDAFMGIDQVTQVSDIVRQALQHRAERMRNAKRGTRNSKSRNPKTLAPDSSLTAAANRQWSIVNRRSFAPPVDVHPRPNYIPDYATPRFRLTPRHFA